jgi:hypothetical protein
MKRKLLLSTFALLTGLSLSACASHRYSYAYGPPPPQRRVVMGYAPGPGYAWCDGYYDRRPSGWIWVDGYWGRPPRPRAVWIAPQWRPHGRDYRFHRGYWH